MFPLTQVVQLVTARTTLSAHMLLQAVHLSVYVSVTCL